jgi:hypothetical protein
VIRKASLVVVTTSIVALAVACGASPGSQGEPVGASEQAIGSPPPLTTCGQPLTLWAQGFPNTWVCDDYIGGTPAPPPYPGINSCSQMTAEAAPADLPFCTWGYQFSPQDSVFLCLKTMPLPADVTCSDPHLGARTVQPLGHDPDNGCFGVSTDSRFGYVYVFNPCDGSPHGCGGPCI